MSEWQKIESAPKDGVDILLCQNKAMFVGSYFLSDDDLGYWICEGIDTYPTHWMPLPPPPKETP